MSAPIIWIYFPILTSVVLYLLRRNETSVQLIGFTITSLLTILAVGMPIGETSPIRIGLGLPAFVIAESTPFLGARFVIGQEIRPQLILLFLAASIWFGYAVATGTGYLFIPIGLGLVGFSIAALTISPSVYASALLAIVALLCLPILSPPGIPVSRGVRQFATMQILGMGLILLANWSILFAAIQADLDINLRVPVFILGLGFALVLPVFPFHSWIISISGKTGNFGKLFVFFLLPTTNALLIFKSFSQISISDFGVGIISIFRMIAILMIGGAGIWSLFEDHLGRISGLLIIHQIGSCLMVLSLLIGETMDPINVSLFVAQFLPFGIALALLDFSIHNIQKNNSSLSINENQNLLRQSPSSAIGVLIAYFSISGFPSLASFPIDIAIWSRIENLTPAMIFFGLFGKASFFFVGFRLIINFASHASIDTSTIKENQLHVLLVIIAGIIIFAMGLFPNFYLGFLN